MTDGYLYRGAVEDEMAQELSAGAITGGTHRVYTGFLDITADDDWEGEYLRDIPWVQSEMSVQAVTGGVTNRLAQTERFSGRRNYAMVLDASAVPFEEVQYEYQWMNNHEGVLPHIVTTAKGEIRRNDPGVDGQNTLYGLYEQTIMADETTRDKVSHWGDGADLPATTPRSMFAEESEWVAQQREVAISDALQGVVTRAGPRAFDRSDNTLAEEYETRREPLPPNTTMYLLVADSDAAKDPADPGYAPADIQRAAGPSGEIDPAAVPPRFRGARA